MAPKKHLRFAVPKVDKKLGAKMLDELNTALKQILGKDNSDLKFGDIYGNANALVRNGGDGLYNKLREVLTNHLKNKVYDDVSASLNNNLLHTLNAAWEEHQICMMKIRDCMGPIDHFYVTSCKHDKKVRVDNVYNLGLKIFRDEVICRENIIGHLRELLLDLVARDRRNEVFERTALRNACKMLSSVSFNARDVYEEGFERAFLQQSVEFYQLESQKFLAENNAFEYIKTVQARIDEEVERARNFFDVMTEPAIVKVLEKELIEKHMKTIVDLENSGAVHMMKNDKKADLLCMYNLFVRVPNGVETLRDCLSVHLREQGESLANNSNQKSPVEYTQCLLDLKDRMDDFRERSFKNDQMFKKMICNDFEWFVNKNKKSSEYLSLFIDDKLKKGTKMLSEQEVDSVLSKSMALFRFLSEKDIFEHYYRMHLARRLLTNKSVSDDSEKSMIAKLKDECGAIFSNKLEGMIKDVEVSRATNEEFKSHIQNDDSLEMGGVDLTVQVLTSGFWANPTSIPNCNLPNEAVLAFNVFRQFYDTKHTGRRLTIMFSRGTADLNAYFYGVDKKPRRHLLVVSTIQMVALMLFNKREKWSFEELQQETDIPEKELTRALLPLACGKQSQRILVKEPKGKEINKNDQLRVNDSFISRVHRVKIQAISRNQGESEPECKVTRAKVDQDRRHLIDAAIVRIMKSKMTLTLQQLIAQVIDQMKDRFCPKPQNIKRRVESLVEREFLKRSEEDMRVFTYIA